MEQLRYTPSLFLGATTRGVPKAVFFDPHTAALNDKPPGCVITGGPGSGKTYCLLTLTAMSKIMGKTTIVLDAKGDTAQLVNLMGEIGKPRVWALASSQRRYNGVLDPFKLTTVTSERIGLVMDLIDIFIKDGLTVEQTTILSPLISDVVKEPDPTLDKVVQRLRNTDDTTARNLGGLLDLVKKQKYANLCFASSGANQESLDAQIGDLTIISMANLDLPKNGEAPSTNSQRLAMGVFFLVLNFIRRKVLAPERNDVPVTVVIDEAHIPISNDKGASLIKEMALLGRSKNLALIMATQNTKHFDKLEIENTITTRFAFKTDSNEAKQIVKEMGLPEGEHFEDLLEVLQRGECLMKDHNNNYATVQISDHRRSWDQAFKTNPQDRTAAAQREKLAKQMAAAQASPGSTSP